MTCPKGKSRKDHSHERRVMWVGIWEYHFILEILFTSAYFLSKLLEVLLKLFAYFVVLDVKADFPDVHVIFEELYFQLIFELCRSH